jgi:hypothetical protein
MTRAHLKRASRPANPVPGYGVALIVLMSILVALILVVLVMQLVKMRTEQHRHEMMSLERQSPLVTSQHSA